MARPTQQELEQKLRSKQIMRTDEVLSLLRQFGFEERRSKKGTSHILIWNPDYPELGTGTVVAGTKKRDSQFNAIKMCLHILEIESAYAKKPLPEEGPEPINVIGAFAKVTTENPDPPDDVEIIESPITQKTYLRHKQYPQIATEILGRDTSTIIDKCAYIRNRVENLKAALDIAVHDCDFEMEQYSNGHIVLMHPAHAGISAVLRPFTPRHENWTSIKVVEKLIDDAVAKKEEYEEGLQPYIDHYGLKELKPSSNARIFEKGNAFDLTIIETVRLPITPNGYFSPIDGIRLIQACENVNWRDFHKVIRRKHGFIVDLQADGTQKFSHPLHDVTFEINSSDLMAPLDDLLEGYLDMSAEDQELESKKIENVLKAYGDRLRIIRNAVAQHDEVTTPWIKEVVDLIPHLNTMKADGKVVLGEIGKFKFVLGNETHSLPVLFRKGVSPDGRATKQLIPTPDTLKILREVKQRQMLEATQSMPRFSLPVTKEKKPRVGDITRMFSLPPQAAPLPPFMAQPPSLGPKAGKN
ncbi:MAG: hypothetical protein GW903_04885 [Alphaproteobacteria bacterium]|nr:hypothetical protein [Alphaproteobacteria bacterium]NCQ88305.1 hypothetical protein [Alphaproteobacteria bacterium]NCT05188.1 hypothetical protein [Alphaproteobacteria bacterium]